MQKYFRIVLAVALIALGIWGWRFLFPSPERVIRSRLVKLAEIASFDPKEGIVPKALKVQNALNFFTPDVVMVIDIRGIGARTVNGRDELRDLSLNTMKENHGLTVEFLDINVTLIPNKQAAVVNLTAKAILSGERDFYLQEFNFRLKKVNGKWLIHRLETVKTLS